MAKAAKDVGAKQRARWRSPKEKLHHRAFRFRIEETPEQARAFARIAGCCRLVYNAGLEARTGDHAERKAELERLRSDPALAEDAEALAAARIASARLARGSVSTIDIINALPAARAGRRYGFLAEVPSHCLQQAAVDLDRAFTNFFEGRAGYPRFRSRYENDSFRFPDARQIRLDEANALLHLPKFGKTKGDAGPLRLRMHRKLRGRIRHVTIIRDGLRWYASIAVGFRKRRRRDAVAEKIRAGGPVVAIGMDRNVGEPVALSAPVALVPDPAPGDGAKPRPAAIETRFLGGATETSGERRKTKRLQRRLARKARGSKNRLKAKRALAAHKAKLLRRRKDRLRKIARATVASADILVLEDLRLKNMTASAKGTAEAPGTNVAQKAGLNREMLDRGHGMLRLFIEEVAAREGRRVILVDPRNTSRECARCHHVDGGSRKGAVFACTACGHADHADLNASEVILHRAADAIAAIVQSALDTLETLPVERRCQPVESSGVALSAKQEAEAARPGEDPSMLFPGGAAASAAA